MVYIKNKQIKQQQKENNETNPFNKKIKIYDFGNALKNCFQI